MTWSPTKMGQFCIKFLGVLPSHNYPFPLTSNSERPRPRSPPRATPPRPNRANSSQTPKNSHNPCLRALDHPNSARYPNHPGTPNNPNTRDNLNRSTHTRHAGITLRTLRAGRRGSIITDAMGTIATHACVGKHSRVNARRPEDRHVDGSKYS